MRTRRSPYWRRGYPFVTLEDLVSVDWHLNCSLGLDPRRFFPFLMDEWMGKGYSEWMGRQMEGRVYVILHPCITRGQGIVAPKV